jgi:two-component system, NarL family, response regulator LiaR
MHDAGRQPGRTRVLIVDDHGLFRIGLSALLEGQKDLEVVAQASGGRAGVRLAAELRPDVILMDLRMPDLDGASAIRLILDHDPAARVLALTVASVEDEVADALLAGACGFLAKDTPIDQMAVAVRAAADGSAWLSARAAELVLGRLRRADTNHVPEPEPLEQLSSREREVLRLLARGMENAEIAQELSISPRTAKNHVSSILAKLGLPSRVQAAVYAVRRGLD